mgnify:CR=1 FL=1
MKAAVLTQVKENIEVQEVPTPEPKPGELLIKLQAAALNRRDWWIQQDKYGRIKLPCILGSDGAGVVEAVGKGVDRSWKGEPVVINPGLQWGDEPAAFGPTFRVLGMPDPGTFAEYISIPLDHVYPQPGHLTPVEAAALPLAGLTAYRALFSRAKIKAKEKILITGIGGGVSLMAAQLAVAKRAEVWVTSGDQEKLGKAQKMGVKGGVNYRDPDWAQQLKDKAGAFDVILDSAGGETFSQLIDLAKPGGRIAVYGATMGNYPPILPAKVFWKQVSILGSTMGSGEEFAEMLAFVEDHLIRPVVDRIFSLENIQEAFDHIGAGKQMGKVVITVDG